MRRLLTAAAAAGAGAYLVGLTGRVADLEAELAQLQIRVEEQIRPVIDRHGEQLEDAGDRLWDVEDLATAMMHGQTGEPRAKRVAERVAHHGHLPRTPIVDIEE